MKSKVFVFVGASGTGKSTLMNYLRENFDIECSELSARPFLKMENGSYDQQMTDEIQLNIMYNNTLTILERLIEIELGEKESVVYSRSPIDTLAYAKTLNKGLCLEKQQQDLIQYLNNKIVYLYIPIEFEMKEESDKLRGLNEDVRNLTDDNICMYLNFLNVPHYIIHGSIEERQQILNEIMNKFDIKRKIQ